MSPKRQAALGVCVAVLLVTAGCTAGTTPASTTSPTGDPTTATETSPATPTTTTATWSPNVSVEQYPPGVADNGTLANASVLVDAHFAATASESVVLTLEAGTGPNRTVKTYAHGDSPTPFAATIDGTVDGTRFARGSYQTAEHGFVRHEFRNRTLYRVTQNTTTPGTDGWLTRGIFGVEYELTGVFYAGNYTVNGTVERGGRTLVELTADEPARNMDTVAAYDGTALVTPKGAIHSVEASYDWGTDENRDPIDISISLDRNAEWTGEPSWVDDPPNLSLSIVEDGRALELRNAGGAALPANTSFEVYGMNATEGGETRIFEDMNGTVTTDASLDPGEAVYMTADENGTSFTLHDDPARGEYAFAAAKLHKRGAGVVYSLVTGLGNQSA